MPHEFHIDKSIISNVSECNNGWIEKKVRKKGHFVETIFQQNNGI